LFGIRRIGFRIAVAGLAQQGHARQKDHPGEHCKADIFLYAHKLFFFLMELGGYDGVR
jgi:hypothetical protein